MAEIWRRLRYLFHRRQHEQDLADEMLLHRELISQSPTRSLGNVTQLHEASRAVWIWPFLETFAQDTRYGLRTLRANPGFAATAVLSLALGIGANTAIFSILNAVMLRSLPVEDPHRLMLLGASHTSSSGSYVTNPIWEQVRDHQQAFSGTLAYSTDRFDLASGGESHFAEGLWASGDFFRVLGVPAMRGRVFTADDDRHGGGHAGPVAVISYGFWKRYFGGDPDIPGKTIRLDRHPFTIIGVTPPWFAGLDVDTPYDVAIPIGCEPILHTDASALADRDWWWLRILGRIHPGETPEQAETKMKALAPEVYRATLPQNPATQDGQRGTPEADLRPASRRHRIFGYRQPVPHRAPHFDGGGGPGSAYCLRKYREPATGSRRGPPARDLHSYGHRRGAPARHASTHVGKPAPLGLGRGGRLALRCMGKPLAGPLFVEGRQRTATRHCARSARAGLHHRRGRIRPGCCSDSRPPCAPPVYRPTTR